MHVLFLPAVLDVIMSISVTFVVVIFGSDFAVSDFFALCFVVKVESLIF